MTLVDRLSSSLSALAVYRDRRVLAILVLGFASGLPLALTGQTLQAWLKESGVSLQSIGLFALAISLDLWHFWASSILLAATSISLAVGPALMTDLVPPTALGKALAWYGFAPSTGGIIGFAVTGYAIQSFGMSTTFIGAAILTLIAILLVMQVQRIQQRVLA